MDRRRRCCQILSKALYKTATSNTFAMINNFSRETDKQTQKGKKTGKMFRLYSRFRLKDAMSRWR